MYLSGEIHTDWREQIASAVADLQLPVRFTSPVTNHEASDAAGDMLGEEKTDFWRDHKSAKVNAIRTQNLLKQCDIAVIRFGEKSKQWNAAFDAGYAAALGKSLVIMHGADHQHALKEVDAAALAVTETPEQVIQILRYVQDGTLPR